MKKTTINIGIEALVAPANPSAKKASSALQTARAYRLLEATLLVEVAVGELNELARFSETASGIAESVRVHGIDAGTEALVGDAMRSVVAKWDKTDAAGTVAAIEAGLESVKDKVSEAVKRVIERLKSFVEKLVLNGKGLQDSFRKNKIRVGKIEASKFAWKKADKVIKTPGKLGKEGAQLSMQATAVIMQLKNPKFNMVKELPAEFMNGSVLKGLREAAAKTVEFKCADFTTAADIKKQYSEALDAGTKVIADFAGFEELRRTVRAVRVSKVEVADTNKVPVGRAVATAASMKTFEGIVALRKLRAALAVLKNIKG
jgi:hypothetical protein